MKYTDDQLFYAFDAWVRDTLNAGCSYDDWDWDTDKREFYVFNEDEDIELGMDEMETYSFDEMIEIFEDEGRLE